jgi:alpha-tubulin suppressor-like RCC1 family protein
MRAVILTLLAACSINVDYTGTYYQCNADGTCPDGFVCRAQVCVPSEPAPPACSTHVASGGGHSCAIKEDGTVWCWGQNDFGQLGDGTATDSSLPVKVPDFVMPGIAIGAGDVYTCALDKTGAVWCWGHNDHGQLGVGSGDNRTASQVPGITGAKQIAVGVAHTCALLGDGTVSCWGQNTKGELGDGGTTDHTPMVVPGLTNIVQITAGDEVTCALDNAGVAKCWGANDVGQLGTGNHTPHPTPVAVANLTDAVKEIVAGHGFTCVELAYNANFCWGAGALGNGVIGQSDLPVQVDAPSGLDHLTAGDDTACGIAADNKLWCWGRNGDDRIGDGSYQDQPQPILSTFVDVVEASVDNNHMCAVDKRGAIRCAGFNRRGELGDGQRLTQGAPQPVLGLASVKSIVAGDNHTCALLGDGTVKCWGFNGSGQLGFGNFESSAVPRTVPGIAAVTELTAGANHTCALLTDTMYCWGENGNGQLGDTAPGDATTPQLSVNFGTIQHIFGGNNNTCAIVGGKPLCVGSFSNTPAQFNGYPSALSIGTGRNHGCVVTTDHIVHCTAGDNFDATLGDGTTMCCSDSSPVMNVTDVVIRGDQSCVLGVDHSVKCWGYNNGVRLGTGDGSYLIKAPEAQSGVMASQISLGGNMGCILRTDMTVACWGEGFFGGVGDTTYNDRNMPVAVSNSLVATQVASGADHACAVMSDGTVQCWGNDSDGELGDGVILSPDPSGVRMTCP